MRNVDSQFDLYKRTVDIALKNFTVALYQLDNYLVENVDNAPMFSLKPKVHMLHHLLDDIKGFGCPLQYETESSEQFNKFIREHLFMTNRQYTSRDVAIRFGKQFICCQIFQGLAFVYVKRWKSRNVWYEQVLRGETGYTIKAMQDNDPEFKKHFFEARENVTDSYQILKSKIVLGLTGLFQTNYGLMLGHVVSNQDGVMVLRKYVLMPNVSGGPSWLPGVESDVDGNLHIMSSVILTVM